MGLELNLIEDQLQTNFLVVICSPLFFGKKIEVNEKKEVLVADLMSKLKLK